MFYIIIPVIMVVIYILFNFKSKKEHFMASSTEIRYGSKKNEISNYTTFIEDKSKKYRIELIKLNPMFEKTKFILQDQTNEEGTTITSIPVNVENTDWKADFQRRLCVGCSCLNPTNYGIVGDSQNDNQAFSSFSDGISPSPSDEISPSPSDEISPSASDGISPTPSDGIIPSPSDEISPSPSQDSSNTTGRINLCGFDENQQRYQCSQSCPECNLCHLDNNGTALDYYSKCDSIKEANDKELCDFFKERVRHVKEKCIFPLDLEDVKLNDKECFSFYRKRDNRYVKNQIIIFRISSLELCQKIEVKKVFYKSKGNIRKMNPIIFYSDIKEHYFYVNTNDLIDFKGEIIVNIHFNIKKDGEDNILKDSLKIMIKEILEYIPKYDEDIGHTIVKNSGTLPSTFDEYSLNYLKESTPKTKQLVSGYSYNNEVEQYGIGEFVKYEYKDSPDTWKLRDDINRPWISVG